VRGTHERYLKALKSGDLVEFNDETWEVVSVATTSKYKPDVLVLLRSMRDLRVIRVAGDNDMTIARHAGNLKESTK
jgi:hypothetical protein